MADTTVSTDTVPGTPPIPAAAPISTEPPISLASADASPQTDTSTQIGTAEPTNTAPPAATSEADDAESEPADAGPPRINFPPKDNAVIKVINRCLRAWDYAYDKKAADLGVDDDNSDAREAASEAYLRAIPPLNGYENICHFIACINHASIIGIISVFKAQHFLANARLALSAIYHQPKPSTELRPVNRRKSSPEPSS